MAKFNLNSPFQPTGDQPQAIEKLTQGVKSGMAEQVLLGVTGSGKTFTMANVIAELNLPTLVISHNKTLAGQLYQEFRDFFPENAVSYFVSYYDYYQPEAYVPQTDTYIEKETDINAEIDKLRLQATSNLLTRRDTIVVASVSCIYNIGSPKEYGNYVVEIELGKCINRLQLLTQLVKLQYIRSGYDFARGTFRLRGERIDIFPAYLDQAVRVEIESDKVTSIFELDPLTGKIIGSKEAIVIYPAKHYMTDPAVLEDAFVHIRQDLTKQVEFFQQRGKFVEAQRIAQRVNYDLEMIKELGYVNGVENYSRYFDGRAPGDPPYTLLDYYHHKYGKNWLLFIDESHMTTPQVRGMYNGDIARKKTLVEFGFRLPAAIDNRPLRFTEFLQRKPATIYVSATPARWEKSRASQIVEQLIRPTGIVDPEIEIRPTNGQIPNLVEEIQQRQQNNERVLVTTLTKRLAEDLTHYLTSEIETKLKVEYLHSDVETLDRQDILDDLRQGKHDVIIGINLLREGLDLPEVSLVAILDADKEGFLRSETSLIQTMGRAARNVKSKVIMYADGVTGSMRRAIDEVSRRRQTQIIYNQQHGIVPKTVLKPIRKKLVEREAEDANKANYRQLLVYKGKTLEQIDGLQMLPTERKRLITLIQKEMRSAAKELNFEKAALLRDKMAEMKSISN